MTQEEAIKHLQQEPITFDVEESMFGDGSYTVSVADLFITKADANKFVQALQVVLTPNS